MYHNNKCCKVWFILFAHDQVVKHLKALDVPYKIMRLLEEEDGYNAVNNHRGLNAQLHIFDTSDTVIRKR